MSDGYSGARNWSIFVGVVLIAAGILAILSPFFAGIAANYLFGWLILLAGIMHLVYAWSERGAGAVIWQVLIGVVYIIAAVCMFMVPLAGMITLTFVLGVYIGLEGILELAAYFRMKHFRAATWFLVDGIVSLILAAMIFWHFPSSAVWVPGTLLGVSLLFSGWARLSFPAGGWALRTA